MSWDAGRLRNAFTSFFVERDHVSLPAALLIPNDPTLLFTVAGMVQFKPYFTGELTPPAPRATTIQPCFRTVDIDLIGTTTRHNTFFEMLGNFSFGDYFKELAIPWAWELVTEVLGFDPELLWITVHESDDEAEQVWRDGVGVRAERIQRMGADNFWQMGDTGPCGPSSEIYFDKGEAFGAPGGPAHGGDERYVEIWNLVFTQYDRQSDATLLELPRKNIDTGAGLERILALLEEKGSIYETSLIAPIVEEAARLTGRLPGSSVEADVALRILADHARAMTFLISDGVFPSNEGRGYVLRRIIRRAVLRAHQLGVTELVTPALADAVVALMSDAYPRLERDRSIVEKVVAREEESFRRTLRAGSLLLEQELARGKQTIPGEVAFRLHDTFGFPIDLTTEIAAERAVRVDLAGFEAAMSEQRLRARQGGRAQHEDPDRQREALRDLLEEFGPSEFVGYESLSGEARVLAVLARSSAGRFENIDGETAPDGAELYDVVLDRTPFYAEGGGQVGDTGVLEGPTGRFRVLDTTLASEGLRRHTGYLLDGELQAGATVLASVDAARRDDIRRNHTGTHLLHWALRQVLGEHVKQQGSLVAPRRLRFDFHHFAPLTEQEIAAVEDLVNREVIADEQVQVREMARSEAEGAGAIAFFGEKYGERVRVVAAGSASVELCGGTHVHATGMIGPLRIAAESSIGANTRRVEATTGARSLEEMRATERALRQAASTLRAAPEEVPAAAERIVAHERQLEDELRRMRLAELADEAAALARRAGGGRVVARRDRLDHAALRELALKVRDHDGVHAVALIGSPDGAKVALVVAARAGSGIDARSAAGAAAPLIGGGGGGSSELATAGGRDVAGIDGALAALSEALSTPAR